MVVAIVLVACARPAPRPTPAVAPASPPRECSEHDRSVAASLSDVLGFLPEGSDVVVGLDLHDARWEGFAPLQQLRTALQQSCGFDPTQSIERISIGLLGDSSGVIVVQGVDRRILSCLARSFEARSIPAVREEQVLHVHRPDGRSSAWTVLDYLSEKPPMHGPGVSRCVTSLLVVGGTDARTAFPRVLRSQIPLRNAQFLRLLDEVDASAPDPSQGGWAVAGGHAARVSEVMSAPRLVTVATLLGLI